MNCPCGSILIPKGTKYSEYGLGLRVLHTQGEIILKLVHDKDSILNNEQEFITTSEKCTLNSDIVITGFEVFWDKRFPSTVSLTNSMITNSMMMIVILTILIMYIIYTI